MFKMFSKRFLYRDNPGKGRHEGMIHRPEFYSKSRMKDQMSDAIAKSKYERLKEQDVMKAQLHVEPVKPAEQKELAKSEVVEKFANEKLEVEKGTREALTDLADEIASGLA